MINILSEITPQQKVEKSQNSIVNNLMSNYESERKKSSI